MTVENPFKPDAPAEECRSRQLFSAAERVINAARNLCLDHSESRRLALMSAVIRFDRLNGRIPSSEGQE